MITDEEARMRAEHLAKDQAQKAYDREYLQVLDQLRPDLLNIIEPSSDAVDRTDYGHEAVQAALTFAAEAEAYISAPGDDPSVAAWTTAENRLLYALLSWYATGSDLPECIDGHLECWLIKLRGTGDIPNDWTPLMDTPGT